MPDHSARIAALQAAAGARIIFRASATPRWLPCPGSIQMSAPYMAEERTSSYAQEGTAAHEVARQALTGERQPDEWVGRQVMIGKVNGLDAGWFVDAEMAECVQVYIDAVREKMQTGNGSFLVEQYLSLAAVDPKDPVLALNGGTADAVILNYDEHVLYIFDLKYGRGVMVSGDSPQLKDYALMAAATWPHPNGAWKKIVTVVVQPRAPGDFRKVKEVEHDPNELWEFVGEMYAAMISALGDAPVLKPGDHCRWCPGKPACPALKDKALNIARSAFDAAPPIMTTESQAVAPNPAAPVALPNPVTVDDPALLADWMEHFPMVETFIEAVRHRVVKLLENGVHVPGWVLTQRTGNRAWVDEDKAPDALRAAGAKTVDLYTEPKLKSPTQVEKLLPKDKRYLVDDEKAGLIVRPLGKHTLVPADKGRTKVAGAFTPLTEG